MGFIASSAGSAAALTADDVMNKMSEDQRFGYISGIVDGLAFARWQQDKPDNAGTQCIYDWYYGGDGAAGQQILRQFEARPERHADVLIYALIKGQCGE